MTLVLVICLSLAIFAALELTHEPQSPTLDDWESWERENPF